VRAQSVISGKTIINVIGWLKKNHQCDWLAEKKSSM
jgi:hypothetical protein